jgi:hypothetical protein
MSTNEFIHFDTISSDCTFNTNNSANSFNFVSGSPFYNPNSFNCTFKLNRPLRNVKSIQLCTLELPISWNNIRTCSNLNVLTLTDNSNNKYSVTIPDNTYHSITQLLIDIQNLYTLNFPSLGLTFTTSLASYYTGNIQINSTNSIFSNGIGVVQNNLSYIMGFRNNSNIEGNLYVIAVCSYLLNPDNFINMYISGINQVSSNPNNNGVKTSFKIPINAVNGVVFYSQIYSSDNQPIETNPNMVISSINVQLIDRWGYNLNSNGMDWSFSLLFNII